MQTPKEKTLLYVTNSINFFVAHKISLAMAAKQNGFSIHIAAPEEKGFDANQEKRFVFHPIPLGRKTISPWKEFRTILFLYRLYKKVRPDLIHHLTIKPMIYGSLAVQFLRFKPYVINAVTGLGYVFVGKDFRSKVLRKIVVPTYRLAFRLKNYAVIFQNPDDQEFFLNKKITQRKNTVLIKGSGVNMTQFPLLPMAQGTPVVMMISRMLWDKGVGEFWESAQQLKRENILARFVLVGDTDDGNPSAVPSSQIQSWVASGAIEWWGYRKDMPQVLAEAHIVCLPSYREGVPRCLIEAASCGRPLITTDEPGCREVVHDGINGYLIPSRNSKILADKLKILLSDPALRQQMGYLGRDLIEKEFSEEIVIKKTLSIYRKSLI